MAYLDDIYAVLQVAPTGVPTYVRLSQNENGRRMIFSVAGGEIPSGSTATISGTKPDGVVYSAACTISGSTVTVNETVQLTAAAGEWDAKIRITNGGNVIATGRVRFVIDADTVNPGAVPSDSELEGLVAEAAGWAEDAKSAAYGSPMKAATVAEMTDKTRVYVYTGSESGYTFGNWYFWNGSAWTSGGVYNSTAVQTDKTLSIPGMAADAEAVGKADSELKADLTQIEDELSHIGLSESVKVALLDVVANIALWKDGDGQQYYDALKTTLYENEYPLIRAIYTNLNTVYTVDTIDSLKQYLTVTYYETSESEGQIIASNDYTLSGVLNDGNNVIKVTYNNYSTTFIVTAVDIASIRTWTYPTNDLTGSVIGVWGQNTSYDRVLSISEQNTRRSLYLKKGEYACRHYTETGNFYPIPVPDGCTQVRISINAGQSMYFAASTYSYNPETDQYSFAAGSASGWVETSGLVNIANVSNPFIIVSYRLGTNANMESVDANSITVEFL